MRKERLGREFYGKNYDVALKLYSEGASVSEIAAKLNMSYSAVYHWVKGLRKPEQGNVNSFVTHLQKSGPTPVIDLKGQFPKHNELFLIASRRGLPVKRYMLKKKYGEYSIWYYLGGQEGQLNQRTDMLMAKVNEVKRKLSSAVNE